MDGPFIELTLIFFTATMGYRVDNLESAGLSIL